MIEKHPFGYYLPQNADKLILGSFPCFNGQDYGDWFYSGSSKNYFWPILGDIFNLPTEDIENKKKVCESHGFAITDIALTINRFNGSCSDSKIRIIESNADTINLIIEGGIKKVYFTSKFVQKNFSILFPKIKLQAFTLPSPSPAANRYIAGLTEYRNLIKAKLINDTYGFRVIKYKEALLENH